MNERVERFLREEGEWMDGWMRMRMRMRRRKGGKENLFKVVFRGRPPPLSLALAEIKSGSEREKDPEVKEF